ncbi:MAG: hypothetical protein RSD28_05885 [Lachnospiraceae bacterium]
MPELELLSDRIEQIEKMLDSQRSDVIEASNTCNKTMAKMYSCLQELQENIVNEIQTNTLMLEEDLGIEFDTKEKFKELAKKYDGK